MNIFISWSGERSKAIAETLREWLPKVLHSVRPWMSDTDISKGSRWNPDISKSLDTAKAGIFCLTPSNLKSESILFEAGAISKSVAESRVYTLLAGIEITSLRWPLAQFQATHLEKGDLLKMLQGINEDLDKSGEICPTSEALEETFDLWWPKLELKFNSLPPDTSNAAAKRSDNEILTELLSLARQQTAMSDRLYHLMSGLESLRERQEMDAVERRALLEEMASHPNRFSVRDPGTLKRAHPLKPIIEAVCRRLDEAGHNTAAAILSTAKWSEADGGFRVETGIKKTMIGLTFNDETMKLVTQELYSLGVPTRVQLISLATPASNEAQRRISGARRVERSADPDR